MRDEQLIPPWCEAGCGVSGAAVGAAVGAISVAAAASLKMILSLTCLVIGIAYDTSSACVGDSIQSEVGWNPAALSSVKVASL